MAVSLNLRKEELKIVGAFSSDGKVALVTVGGKGKEHKKNIRVFIPRFSGHS
ncbi:MAG: hypothetical protein SWO11_20260 [Thermodesulfobacteriota bacterium]|nr:hypothetical protein [Thermodesulfobacteriota bacterium]